MNRFPAIFSFPPRDSAGGEGGGSPLAPAPAASQGGAPGGGEGIAPPSPPSGAPDGDAWKMPDGLPDHLKAENAVEFADKIAADWRKQRETISKLPAAPKSAEDYAFAPSDKVKDLVGDLSQDGTFKAVRDAALNAGIPAEAFQKLVGGFYDHLAESGQLLPQATLKGEAEKLLGKSFSDEKEAQAALAPVFEPVQRFIDGVADRHNLDPASKAALYGLLDMADGVRAVQALMAEAKTPGLQTGGEGGGETLTREKLQQMQRDPRAIFGNPKYDQAFVASIDEGYKRLK
jgi:hypothetical protein